jgi:hypothetical protein
MTGVIILIRHGDRGPLQHVRNITAVNCGTEETEKFISYKVIYCIGSRKPDKQVFGLIFAFSV